MVFLKSYSTYQRKNREMRFVFPILAETGRLPEPEIRPWSKNLNCQQLSEFSIVIVATLIILQVFFLTYLSLWLIQKPLWESL